MSIFGGGNNQPTRLSGIRITQSVLGYAVPVVMGQGRIQQSLIWTDGFSSKQESSGGKGVGKGSTFYLYSADVIAALCNGPVTSIGNVWAGQSWLNATSTYEVITVASVYAPSNAAILIADNGVGIANTFSGTYTDY